MEFFYKAKNQAGATVEGQIQATNENEAAKLLAQQKLFVLDLDYGEQTSFQKGFTLRRKVSLKDKIIFTKELAMMIKGGLPLIDSLDALAEQSENREFSRIIGQVMVDVKGGLALSKSLAKHPKVFPTLYIAITASGEKSGKLDEVLTRLADQLQKDYELNSRVKNALTYPVVVTIALIGIMILMLVFVVPQLKIIFSEMGVSLPIPTLIILGTSDFIIKYWYIIIIVVIGLIVAWRAWAKTSGGGIAIDKFKIKVWLFGPLMKKIYLARFSRTMATLIASGLPMLEIIDTVKLVVGNKIYVTAMEAMHRDIESGVPLSMSLRKHNIYQIFPAMISHMTAMGEKSGKVDYVLFEVADFYDKEVEATTQNLTSLIEPILILIIGGGVGIAIASVILPIYSLVNAI
jgi:type IV pilus assembly protein PilC